MECSVILWNLRKEKFYKTAIFYAREKNYPEIVDLLSKGPIKATKEIPNDVESLMQENESLKLKNQKLEDENSKLKKFFFAMKEKSSELEFFDFADYSVQSVIGEGATSNVKLVIKNEKFAMKELKNSDHKTVKRFLTEGEVMFILRHPCILDIIAVNYGNNEHPPSLILSYEPSSLESAIASKQLNESQKCMITVEVVLGMRYIHSHNYMHRDLKPSNILLCKEGHVRISDFGLAKEEDLETSQSKGVGTLRFMAPELLSSDEDDDSRYTNKIDVYAFGITLVYIVTGSYPKFNMKNTITGVLPPLPETIVNWVRELIVKCMALEPENRPSFAEIFEILKANNYDLFTKSEEGSKKLTTKQQNLKKEIDERVLMIEAYEFQHQND